MFFARDYFKIYSGFSTPHQRDICFFSFTYKRGDKMITLFLWLCSLYQPIDPHTMQTGTAGGHLSGPMTAKGSTIGKVRTGICKLQSVSLVGYTEVRADSCFGADLVVWRNWVVFPGTTWMSACCWCRVTRHAALWGTLIVMNERFTNSNNQSLKAKQWPCKRNTCKQTIFVSQILLSLLQNTVILGNKSYSV